MENKRSLSGLVRKVVAPVLIGAASLVPMSKANGEMIYLTSTFNQGISAPDVSLEHKEMANEGYFEDEDTIYSQTNFPAPAVDFYSMLSTHSNNKLGVDVRDLTSTTTYNTQMWGRGLPATQDTLGNLTFYVDAATSFGGKPIYADIRKFDTTPGLPNGGLVSEILNIDVRDYAQDSTPFELSFAGDKTIYNIDVKFVPEPGTLSLLAMAGLAGAGAAAYSALRKKK